MKPADSELAQALALIEAAVRAKQPLNHYHARALLLPLGEQLVQLADLETRSTVATVAALIAPVRKAWDRAVREEIGMAVTEFVKSVDEQYLARPGYDFAYTIEARRRLEVRQRAAGALGIDCPTDWGRQVERADRILALYVSRSTGRPPQGGH